MDDRIDAVSAQSSTVAGVKPFTLSSFWLSSRPLRRTLDALNAEGTARVVGGAVRNSILDKPPGDIDIATDLFPERVQRAAERAGLSVRPTGIEHGTLTLISDGIPFEVTTLREDVSTDGRHAIVKFTDDWARDASRRDFTMNALYVDGEGNGTDYVGGYGDCVARRVRFIGDPIQRILEDNLRILRFFRFHAGYGEGALDPSGLDAARALKDTLPTLSAERVLHELSKLLVSPGAPDVVDVMSSAGILAVTTGVPVDAGRYRALCAAVRVGGRPIDPALAFLALVGFNAATFDDVAKRLRFSRRMRTRGLAALEAASHLPPQSVPHIRALLYEHGAEAFTDGLMVAIAQGADIVEPAILIGEARRWSKPRFPVGGHDLMEMGASAGPQIGERLRRLEAIWRDSDFTLSRDALLALDKETRREGT
ncbi:MAG: CCA tRNA nucleotidyltransferase [Pseudomonadota bacterium]